MPHINKLNHKLYIPSAVKILLHKPCPAELFALRNLGVAIAGKIDKAAGLKPEKINSHGLSRNGADPCKRFSSEYLVKKRRLSDV